MNLFKKQEVKYCINCKYYEEFKFSPTLSICRSPNNKRNLIDGQMEKSYCDVLRSYNCGKSAKWFEPKDQS